MKKIYSVLAKLAMIALMAIVSLDLTAQSLFGLTDSRLSQSNNRLGAISDLISTLGGSKTGDSALDALTSSAIDVATKSSGITGSISDLLSKASTISTLASSSQKTQQRTSLLTSLTGLAKDVKGQNSSVISLLGKANSLYATASKVGSAAEKLQKLSKLKDILKLLNLTKSETLFQTSAIGNIISGVKGMR